MLEAVQHTLSEMLANAAIAMIIRKCRRSIITSLPRVVCRLLVLVCMLACGTTMMVAMPLNVMVTMMMRRAQDDRLTQKQGHQDDRQA